MPRLTASVNNRSSRRWYLDPWRYSMARGLPVFVCEKSLLRWSSHQPGIVLIYNHPGLIPIMTSQFGKKNNPWTGLLICSWIGGDWPRASRSYSNDHSSNCTRYRTYLYYSDSVLVLLPHRHRAKHITLNSQDDKTRFQSVLFLGQTSNCIRSIRFVSTCTCVTNHSNLEECHPLNHRCALVACACVILHTNFPVIYRER